MQLLTELEFTPVCRVSVSAFLSTILLFSPSSQFDIPKKKNYIRKRKKKISSCISPFVLNLEVFAMGSLPMLSSWVFHACGTLTIGPEESRLHWASWCLDPSPYPHQKMIQILTLYRPWISTGQRWKQTILRAEGLLIITRWPNFIGRKCIWRFMNNNIVLCWHTMEDIWLQPPATEDRSPE